LHDRFVLYAIGSDKRRATPKETLTLRAFARFGDLATPDGGQTFLLRQVA
jgi:hypothetical protein